MTKATQRCFGLGMLASTLYAAFCLADALPAGTLSCGLGLPPDAPGYTKAQERIAREEKENGYQKVCDANLDRFRITFQPLGATTANLAFQPVDLSGTPFAHFEKLGAMIEPGNMPQSRVYRGYRMPGGRTVTLFEHDMSADGTSTWRDAGDEPERINGLPARLAVWQAPSGNAISHLSWVEQRRSYELWIDANVVNTPLREQLFTLAKSLPPSVPACPNEIPPKPARLGADGFPAYEPMPSTLTGAEMDAMSAKSKRPCK